MYTHIVSRKSTFFSCGRFLTSFTHHLPIWKNLILVDVTGYHCILPSRLDKHSDGDRNDIFIQLVRKKTRNAVNYFSGILVDFQSLKLRFLARVLDFFLYSLSSDVFDKFTNGLECIYMIFITSHIHYWLKTTIVRNYYERIE